MILFQIGQSVYFKHDSNKTKFKIIWINPDKHPNQEYQLNDGSYIRHNEIDLLK